MSAIVPVALDEVLKHPGIWRRSASAQHHVRALPTGLAGLDALLPGGGWPCGALSEILFEYDGLGELTLLMPALAELTRRQQRVVFVAPPYIPYAPALAEHGLDLRYVVQIESTANEGAWSAEQCLRSGSCGAVLTWWFGESASLARGPGAPASDSSKPRADTDRAAAALTNSGRMRAAPSDTTYTQLRRLQLAAESGDALAFLFRPAQAATKASPASLRLQLHAGGDGDEDDDSDRIDIEIIKCRGNLDRRRPTRLRWSRRSSASA